MRLFLNVSFFHTFSACSPAHFSPHSLMSLVTVLHNFYSGFPIGGAAVGSNLFDHSPTDYRYNYNDYNLPAIAAICCLFFLPLSLWTTGTRVRRNGISRSRSSRRSKGLVSVVILVVVKMMLIITTDGRALSNQVSEGICSTNEKVSCHGKCGKFLLVLY